jgi:hypothetical protein
MSRRNEVKESRGCRPGVKHFSSCVISFLGSCLCSDTNISRPDVLSREMSQCVTLASDFLPSAIQGTELAPVSCRCTRKEDRAGEPTSYALDVATECTRRVTGLEALEQQKSAWMEQQKMAWFDARRAEWETGGRQTSWAEWVAE